MRRTTLSALRRASANFVTSSRTTCLASGVGLVELLAAPATQRVFYEPISLLAKRSLAAGPGSGNGAVAGSGAGFSASAPPPSAPPSEVDVASIQDFQSLLQLSSSVAVILQAHAAWCGPCKQLTPVLRAAVERTAGAVVLARLDIDNPALAPLVQQMQITSVPVMYLIAGGRLLDTKQGVPPQQELLAWVNEIADLSREQYGAGGSGTAAPEPGRVPPDQLVTAGWDALLGSGGEEPPPRSEDVAPLFGQVLQESSGATAEQKAAAWAGMAVCALLEGNVEGAKDLIASAQKAVPKDAPLLPDEVSRAEALVALAEETAELPQAAGSEPAAGATELEAMYTRALRCFAARQHKEAIEAALGIVKADKDWREQAGKRLVLQMSAALGKQHELTRATRRRLANLLFI